MKTLKKLKTVLAIALSMYLPMKAEAWGMLGHRIVGEVADAYLNAKTRKEIKNILGYESIAMASNWPDFIKSDSTFNYLSSWHYVNLPAGLNKQGVFSYLENEKTANVYNKIPDMIARLKNPNSSLDEKKLALRMLIHLVGDLHQPMHTARKDDLGGNKVLLTWFNEKSNLHRVWDESLINYQQLSYTEYARAINHPSAIQMYNWKKSTLQDYVWESYQICNKIYEVTKPDSRLSYRYNFDFIDTVNEQLLKGGIRLAKILNDIYTKK